MNNTLHRQVHTFTTIGMNTIGIHLLLACVSAQDRLLISFIMLKMIFLAKVIPYVPESKAAIRP